jgi:phosphatidylglycerophosphate synthase
MTPSSVPDIATLRAICHSGKVSKDRRFWYGLSRRISIHVTWLLLHTPVRPNDVTIATVAFAFLGSGLLAARSATIALAGAVVLLGHYFLDKVDGDIARFRKIYSLAGVYLDDLGHSITYGGIFAGLGLHLAQHATGANGAITILGTAAVGGLAMVIGNQNKNAGFLLFARSVLVQPELLPTGRRAGGLHVLSRAATHESRQAGAAPPGGGARLLGGLRDAALLVSDYSVMLPLVTAGLVVEVVTGDRRVLTALLYGEAAVQTLVLLGLVWINYSVNVESEALRLDALVRGRNDTARRD